MSENFVARLVGEEPDFDTVNVVVTGYHRDTFEGHGIIMVTSDDRYDEGVTAHLSVEQVQQLIENLQSAVRYLTRT